MNRIKLAKAFLAVTVCISTALQPVLTARAENGLSDSGFEVVTDGSGINVGAALYTGSDAKPLEAIVPGSSVNSSVKVKNTAQEEKSVAVITVLYNADNAMEDICAKHITLAAGAEENVTNSVNVPSGTDDGRTIQTFVLESFNNMYSYCESFSYPAAPSVETAWDMGSAFSLSSEKVYSGYSALKIKGSASECSQPVTLSKNSMYKMSFLGKGDADLDYGVYTKSGTAISNVKKLEPSADWNTNSVLFKSADNDSAVVKFMNNGTGSAYVDDASVSGNLIVNGGFEASDMGWVLDSSCYEISSASVYAGDGALKITSSKSGSRAYQETDVIAHCKGMISFKSKCSEDVIFKVLDADSNELISKAGTTVKSSGSWQNNYVFVNTLGYDRVKLCFETKGSAGRVSYIDEIEFSNLQYPDELVNSDFENGTEGWTAAYSTVMTTSDNVFSGAASCRLANRTKVYSSISQRVEGILNKYGPGSYYLEAYVRPQLDITGGWAVARVRYTPSGGSEAQKTLNISNPTAEWHKISGIVDLSWSADISSARISFETSQRTEDSALTSDLFVDDVSFFKMPD